VIRQRQTHKQIVSHPKVIRCLGLLDGYPLYVAKTGYMPPLNGVTLRVPYITEEAWRKIREEMRGPGRADHDAIFLEECQVEDLLKWAGDRLASVTDESCPSKEAPCPDCKNGWYVGLVERRVCPSCNGTRKVIIYV